MESEVNRLNKHFDDWKKAHINECDDSCKKTFPKNTEGKSPDSKTFKNSFCFDGFLSDKFNGVLFILKESNTCSDEPKGEYEDTFWFRDCEGAKRWNLYHNSMECYLNEFRKTHPEQEINYFECAYMNLNKRGGYGACDFTQLSEYVERYRDLIKKQIEIINPEHIFCCGSDDVIALVEPIVREIINNAKPHTPITLYNCYHLCFNRRKIKNTIIVKSNIK